MFGRKKSAPAIATSSSSSSASSFSASSSSTYTRRNSSSHLPTTTTTSSGRLVASSSHSSLASLSSTASASSTSGKDKFVIRCVLVGASSVGKTNLVQMFAKTICPTEYSETILDHYEFEAPVGGTMAHLSVWDTSGNTKFSRSRQACYENSDVALLCFAINSMDSFEFVQQLFTAELQILAPTLPIVLVGLKSDLRFTRPNPVPEDVCVATAKIMKAPYVECSSRSNPRVSDAFEQALRIVEEKRASKNVRSRSKTMPPNARRPSSIFQTLSSHN